VAVARRVHAARRTADATALDRIAVVFKRPLPYLYLAPAIFGDAGLPYQTSAALPLAAEPTAAALDLVLDAAESKFTRSTLVALLRSPHFVYVDGDSTITLEAISAFDRALSAARYLGEPDRLAAVAGEWTDETSRPALAVALAIVEDLAPLADAQPASRQLARLGAFWSSRLRPLAGVNTRERRARAAIDDMLSTLASACAAHDDPAWTIDELAIAVRRTIGDATFTADSDAAGVQLLDDQAARYGDFDDVTIVGVADTDWPERPRRNIFYPPGLIRALGWPPEQERRAAADARFVDLLGAAGRRTAVFTFTLDDDALVTRSAQLDEIPRAKLSSVTEDVDLSERIFPDERLSTEPVSFELLEPDALEWANVRRSRPAADLPEFHGTTALPRSTQPWAVSALETYLECPFKFFARRVLKLEEEPDDEEVMDPRRQGQFVHAVFERFFVEWQEAGHGTITPQNLETAREMFARVVDRSLEDLPPAEAGLERARLLGSPAAAGLGEAVLRMEAERPVAVVNRLLEEELRGSFTFASAGGARTIPLRGKADRIDLLEDGTFRLIDYKLGRAPNRSKALQLPIYSLCAEQQLRRRWVLGEAMYLAFKGPRRVVPLAASPADRQKTLADAQQRLVDTVDAIERGEFPPKPDDVFLCEMCSFPAVCRKDYVGDV
jgi:RecB family exonuclease